MMKIRLLFIILILFSCSCGTKNLNSKDSDIVKLHANAVKVRITGKSRDFIQNDIRNTTIGRTGYYFIINSTGEILNHPVDELIGHNINEFVNSGRLNLTANDQKYIIYENKEGLKNLLYMKKMDNTKIICINAVLDGNFSEYTIQ